MFTLSVAALYLFSLIKQVQIGQNMLMSEYAKQNKAMATFSSTEIQRQICDERANTKYLQAWDKACQAVGKTNNCGLSNELFASLSKIKDTEKQTCLKDNNLAPISSSSK